MGEKIVVGPFNKGLTRDIQPFAIDNGAFPTLLNAYQWRGRIKRKRGTSFLCRLTRFFDSTDTSYNSGSTTITLDGTGAGNLITGFSLETNSAIEPGNVTITVGVNVYTDPSEDGTLSPSGSINYASGAIVIAAEAGNNAEAQFNYFPSLPVLGLETFATPLGNDDLTIGFDTTYAYNILNTDPFPSYSVSFYKNPATGAYTNYIQKTNPTPVNWNSLDYMQFWSESAENAMWVTNGVAVPYNATKVGMPFMSPTEITVIVAGPPAEITLLIVNHGLEVGDFVFFNEFSDAVVTGLNFQTGYVTAIVANVSITVTLPNATLGGAGGVISSGIIQYLTSNPDTTKDCLRWYDGDPTDGITPIPSFLPGKGWVNFCPPLSREIFSVADLPEEQYYLVSCKFILSFKDRLLFFGPVVQSSSGSPIFLGDTLVFSQNGTPYYTASFTGEVSSAATDFNAILTPDNTTATPRAYWEDVAGFGGYITLGLNEQFIGGAYNGDAIIIGTSGPFQRLIYTGNDALPFNFFQINADLTCNATFSTIELDQGVLSWGDRGIQIANQNEARRIDLDIPDQVFELRALDNGMERITSERDFLNEWVYFTYPNNKYSLRFPTQTLFYNYRDLSWAIFRETFTTYGKFRVKEGFTWATAGERFGTWNGWNEPWNAGSTTLLQEKIIAGNQQGFVVVREVGTAESKLLQIQSFTANLISSVDHCLTTNDFIVIENCLGTVGNVVNGVPYQVRVITEDTFEIDTDLTGLTYLGNGTIKRMYAPFIQTKQFPSSWSMGRKTLLGPQMYLFTATSSAQITLNIYLSMDGDLPYNSNLIYPNPNTPNDALVFSNILYTCPESTNLGLTPVNINLNMTRPPFGSPIWHRMNTGLVGDTVQIGFTLSDDQMLDSNLNYQFAEIELHGFILDIKPSALLA